MSLIQDKLLVKPNSYVISLEDITFISYKENESKHEEYWLKLYFGDMESSRFVRYVARTKDELKEIVYQWAGLKDIDMTEDDLDKLQR
tara:strand:+ start:2154 stop:2417 length:264 start_codon:yes stop_codon:yes gene_type:complete